MRSNRITLRPLQDFLKTEAAAGLLLVTMVPLALLWANGPLSDSYQSLWTSVASVDIGPIGLHLDFRHWVNDGLMTVFFFVVGLEIKRELVEGELRDRRKAVTPIAAAIGGMVLPAVIYFALNAGDAGASGWGVPMATDIAIVLGLLALLGDRIPPSLKTFLLTLAIVDDVGAILVIAIFYSNGVSIAPLLMAVGLVMIVYVLGRLDLRSPVVIVVLSGAAWIALHESGVHATLIGVALALATPSSPVRHRELIDGDALGDLSTADAARESVAIARNSVSSVEWLQHLLHPWSSYVILPLFALANAGILLRAETLDSALTSTVTLGVVLGLIVGKTVGISVATVVATRCGGALPGGVTLRGVVAASVLAAVGFTVSLFISDLAFADPVLADEARIGVLVASFAAGGVGLLLLRFVKLRVT